MVAFRIEKRKAWARVVACRLVPKAEAADFNLNHLSHYIKSRSLENNHIIIRFSRLKLRSPSFSPLPVLLLSKDGIFESYLSLHC
ncbi:hypothetical protein V6N13_145189 [Hibiscus sabdariffa]